MYGLSEIKIYIYIYTNVHNHKGLRQLLFKKNRKLPVPFSIQIQIIQLFVFVSLKKRKLPVPFSIAAFVDWHAFYF